MWAVVSIITVSRVLFEDLPVGVKHVLFSWQNLKSRSETYHLPTVKVTLFGNTNTRLYTPVRAGTGSLVTGDMLKMPLTSPHNTPWVAATYQHAKTVSTSHFSSLGWARLWLELHHQQNITFSPRHFTSLTSLAFSSPILGFLVSWIPQAWNWIQDAGVLF